MNFNEWLNQQEDFHLVAETFTTDQIAILRIGWNAALNEAVKINIEADPYCEHAAMLAEAIKELKS